jgi:hypothetical protein
MRLVTALLFSAALLGCPAPTPPNPAPGPDADAAPGPTPPPSPDGSPPAPPGDCAKACAALAAANCPEGLAPNCVDRFTTIDQRRLERVPCGAAVCPSVTCAALSGVRNAAEARALGQKCAGGR